MQVLRQIFRRSAPSASAGYSDAIFRQGDLQTAKAIILNPAPDMTTDERWEFETRAVVEEMGRALNLDAGSRVLDYGCGIGRLSKALIERYGCSVLGVDISPDMRRLAATYVGSERFRTCEPAELDRLLKYGYSATAACACWVLQHCREPDQDIARIVAALVPGGRLFVLNSDYRWVPTDEGWRADAVSVEELLRARLEVLSKSGVSHLVGSAVIAGQSYALVAERKSP